MEIEITSNTTDVAINHKVNDDVMIVKGDDDRFPPGTIGIVTFHAGDHYHVEFPNETLGEEPYIWYYADHESKAV